jgi:hypothetical protein
VRFRECDGFGKQPARLRFGWAHRDHDRFMPFDDDLGTGAHTRQHVGLQKPLIEMQRQPRVFRRLSGRQTPQRKKPTTRRNASARQRTPCRNSRPAAAIGMNLEGPEFGQDRSTQH